MSSYVLVQGQPLRAHTGPSSWWYVGGGGGFCAAGGWPLRGLSAARVFPGLVGSRLSGSAVVSGSLSIVVSIDSPQSRFGARVSCGPVAIALLCCSSRVATWLREIPAQGKSPAGL